MTNAPPGYPGTPAPPVKKVRFMRPRVTILKQNTVIEESILEFEERIQKFMDERRDAGESDQLAFNIIADSQAGLVAWFRWLEFERMAMIDTRTGEEIASESKSGLIAPTQRKIVPIT